MIEIQKDITSSIKSLYHSGIAEIALLRYRNPAKDLRVIGVTGTDGKTTTTNIIYWILRFSGKKVGVVSTINAKIGNKEYDTGFHVTNPEPMALQKILREMVDSKCEFAVLEVTSHGLDQKRVAGINFEVGVLTNITHEHLNYHGTFKEYRRIKSKLFENSKIGVVNRDDPSYGFVSAVVQKNGRLVSYGVENIADFSSIDIKYLRNGMSFIVKSEDSKQLVNTKLLGKYNISNILAGVAVARVLGVEWKEIIGAIKTFEPLVGRLEEIPNDKGIKIYVDFAHTPNALENLLTLLRERHNKGRLIAVLGCAGQRDIEKREMMGATAARFADISIFTAEDPRYEDVNDVIDQISKGAMKTGLKEKEGKRFFLRIPERGEAIYEAINTIADKDDLVVICGKGHEKSMAYGNIEYPWSDQKAVEMSLSGKVFKISHI